MIWKLLLKNGPIEIIPNMETVGASRMSPKQKEQFYTKETM